MRGPLKKLVAWVARGVKLFRYVSRHIVGAEIQRISRNPLTGKMLPIKEESPAAWKCAQNFGA
jgi:hypothetical protein